eukprot:TRINITY_DN33085_c0_g1_i1.p1 TRINITY_DN33085_c0_g1~~TRINITY_DN33085_c0_g1_i1.p1  ORF type:complete len:358 (+),score=52.17 TRINITY_DN33085_c0_g1_i1:58-1131(+)
MPPITEQRSVGSSTLKLPILGLGCSPLGELWDEVPAIEALRAIEAAHAVGFTHFDTAPWYGNGMSEARLGMALNTVKQKDGRFTLVTKVGRFLDPSPRTKETGGAWHGGYDLRVRYDYSREAIVQQHRESCLRLGLSAVDGLVIHDLDRAHHPEEQIKKSLEDLRQGGMQALRELKQEHKIHAIGIGCNSYKWGSKEVCQAVADMGGLDFILLAGPYNLLSQEALDDLLPLCREKNMSVVIGGPFASGILATGTRGPKKRRLTYMYEPAPEDVLDRVERMEKVCDRHGVDLPSAALQFPLFHPRVACVLSGVKSEGESLRAKESMEKEIPLEFWKELKSEGLIRKDAPIQGESTSHL